MRQIVVSFQELCPWTPLGGLQRPQTPSWLICPQTQRPNYVHAWRTGSVGPVLTGSLFKWPRLIWLNQTISKNMAPVLRYGMWQCVDYIF